MCFGRSTILSVSAIQDAVIWSLQPNRALQSLHHLPLHRYALHDCVEFINPHFRDIFVTIIILHYGLKVVFVCLNITSSSLYRLTLKHSTYNFFFSYNSPLSSYKGTQHFTEKNHISPVKVANSYTQQRNSPVKVADLYHQLKIFSISGL